MGIDFDGFAGEIVGSDFGKPAVYTPAGGPARTIDVVFGDAFVVVDGPGEAGMGTTSPQALCKASDVAGAARGDTVAVDGTAYSVVEPQPGGDGFTVLLLSRDA
jgi:hypothetical protein